MRTGWCGRRRQGNCKTAVVFALVSNVPSGDYSRLGIYSVRPTDGIVRGIKGCLVARSLIPAGGKI